MKRIVVTLIALALVFSFIGCDAMIDVMNTMGSNVAGVEKKVVDDSLKAAKVTPSKAKVEDVDGTKTASFISGEGDDAKTLFAFSSGKKTNEIGEEEDVTTLTFGEGKNSFTLDVKGVALDPESVEAIITPSDISGVISGLKSGSKAEIEAELKKPADPESKKAAEGTQQVLKALLNEVMPKKDISPELPQDVIDEHEAFNKKLEDAIDSILGNGSEEELTQGDVVVLTALTNVAMNEKLVDSIMFLTSEEPKLEDYGGNEIEHQEAVDKFNKEKEEVGKEFTQDLVNEALTLVDIVSVVPSDMGSGIADLINTFMSGN